MVKRIGRRFVWAMPHLGMDVEDLHAEGRIAVLRAVRSYDARDARCRGKESSYVGTCILRAYADLGKAAAREMRGGDGERAAGVVDCIEFEEWMLVVFSFADEMEARADVAKLRRRLPETMMALLILRFGYGYEIEDLRRLTGLGRGVLHKEIEGARQRAIELLAA